MPEEWIEDLAQDIKEKNQETAQEYGRSQHYAGIIDTRGKQFFVALGLCLKENVDALRANLQGHAASSDTSVQTIHPAEVKIVRARFPWVDARVTHQEETITLDYARGPGVAGESEASEGPRKTRAFAFRIAPDDSLFVEDSFAELPQEYRQPEDLARHITEILFAA